MSWKDTGESVLKSSEVVKNKFTFLLIGILFLVISSAVSILVLHRLDNVMKQRQYSFKIQNKISSLDLLVKEWLLLNLAYKENPSNELFTQKELTKNEINDLFVNLKNRLETDQDSFDRILNLELEWLKITQEAFPGHNVLEYFSFETKQLEKYHSDLIGIQNPLVDSNFRLIYLLSAFLLLLSAIIVAAALYLFKKEQTIKNNLIDQLLVSKEEAQASSRLKSQILATVSHEIRTPLNGIIGMCEILDSNKDLPEKVKNKIRVISSSGKTLNHIINDILDFSKVEAGKIAVNNTYFNLYRLCQNVIETLNFQATKKDIALMLEYDEDVSYNFEADKDLISQILFNLVGNAIKFTHNGYVTLKISQATSNKICFSVIDTGIGMEKENLNKIFEPFYQSKNPYVHEKGTGLGLTICKRLVELMNGRIQVASNPNKGSRFDVFVPLKPVNAQLVKGSRAQDAANERKKIVFTQMKALIVEDNPTNQIIITNMLELLRIKHEVANHGAEALKMIKDSSFDCVFMDCQMPVMDGYEATEKIRKFGFKQPIFAMTANAAGENKEKCKEVGMDDFISKPISLDGIISVLEKYFADKISSSDEADKIETLEPDPQSLQKAESTFAEEEHDLFGFQESIKFTLERLAKETNDQVVKQILDSFKTSLSKMVEEFNSDYNNLEHLQRIAHKYKSSSRLIGAEALVSICKNIEISKKLDEAQGHIEELTKVIPNLRIYLDEISKPS